MLLQATGIFGFLSFGWADLLDTLLDVGVLAIIILFQPEIRLAPTGRRPSGELAAKGV